MNKNIKIKLFAELNKLLSVILLSKDNRNNINLDLLNYYSNNKILSFNLNAYKKEEEEEVVVNKDKDKESVKFLNNSTKKEKAKGDINLIKTEEEEENNALSRYYLEDINLKDYLNHEANKIKSTRTKDKAYYTLEAEEEETTDLRANELKLSFYETKDLNILNNKYSNNIIKANKTISSYGNSKTNRSAKSNKTLSSFLIANKSKEKERRFSYISTVSNNNHKRNNINNNNYDNNNNISYSKTFSNFNNSNNNVNNNNNVSVSKSKGSNYLNEKLDKFLKQSSLKDLTGSNRNINIINLSKMQKNVSKFFKENEQIKIRIDIRDLMEN